jgi:DNA-binding transcriptional regulator YbjK
VYPRSVFLFAKNVRCLREWVSDLDKAEREERKKTILDMWLKCYTAEEIGEVVGLEEKAIRTELSVFLAELPKRRKVQFLDDFTPPIYNVWSYGKKSHAPLKVAWD